MNRRDFLELAGLVSIGTLVNSAPAVQLLSGFAQNNLNAQQPRTAPVQNYSYVNQLERKIAKAILEETPTILKWPEEYGYENEFGKEYIDKKTGMDVTAQIKEKFAKLAASNPQKFDNIEPEDVFDYIIMRRFTLGSLGISGRIEGHESTGWVEAKVYHSDNKHFEENWNDPKNYLKLGWFDQPTSTWSYYTDQGFAGRVSQSWSPFIIDKQRAFVEYLQRIENIFLNR